MNIRLLLLVIFAIPVSLWSSEKYDEYFLAANHAFANEKYIQACDLYKKIESPGFVTNYNLAVSYAYQMQRGQAILYARRAEKQATYRELTKLYQLFDYLDRQVDPDYVPSWQQQLAIFFKKCILSIPILLLQIALLIGCMLIIIYWYNRWNLLRHRVLLWITLLYGIIIGCWWYKNFYMQRQHGVVIKNEVCLRAGPHTSFYKKSELHESDEVEIMGYQSGYYQIERDSMRGWIDKKDIEVV